MNQIDVIKKFLEYAEYDPDRKSHNLFSMQYEMHKVCENIKSILEYDPAGSFAALFAKHSFEKLMKEAKVSAYDLLYTPDCLSEEREMTAVFQSAEMVGCENDLLEAFDKLISKIIPVKMLGNRNRDGERDALMSSIEATGTQLHKCQLDVFKKGGEIKPFTNYSVYIHLFERLSECLMAIEQAEDGIYLCYISENMSVDGYFGFMLKNNGNIFFVNERVSEAYPGQHKNCRSARYSEDKQYELFPYNFVFSFEEHDRLGYATKHIIQEQNLAFFNLHPKAYMPLIIAMLMLNAKYTGFDLSGERLKYIDSLLPNSLALPTPGAKELMVPSGSAIALQHKEFSIQLTTADVVDGTHGAEFDWRNREKHPEYSHDEFGHFDTSVATEYFSFKNDSQLFVSLYSDGFELDTNRLLEANQHLKRLTSSELATTELTPHVEFVGSKRKMDLVAYQQGRAQLAEYIKDRIAEEYFAFGGPEAVDKWWEETVLANKETILKWCIAKSTEQEGVIPQGVRVNFQENSKGRIEQNGFIDFNDLWYAVHPFNRPVDYRHNAYLCCECDNKASIFFLIEFEDWIGMSAFTGKELPKIIKGWRQHGHSVHGNPILSVCDDVTGIGTPMEYHESQFNPRYKDIKPSTGWRPLSSRKDFELWIGFSKRTWNRILKENQDQK